MKKKSPVNNRSLPKGYVLAWSTQAISYALHFLGIGYLTYYCTNSLGLSAGLVGALLLVSKIFDGITDVIAAVVIERCNSKMGKGRAFMLLMPLAWVLTVVLFSTPSMGTVGKALFVFVLYFMINSVCITLVTAAEPVYMARSLNNTEDSSTVLSLSGLISGMCASVGGMVMPLLIEKFGTVDGGWTIIMSAFAIPGFILAFIRFACIREKHNIQVSGPIEKKYGFKDILRVLIGNPHVLILIVVQTLANLYSGLSTAVATYYYQYIIGDLGIQSIVALTSVIGMLVLALVPALIKKFGLKKVMTAGMILGIIGCVIRIKPTLGILLISGFLLSVATIPTGMLLPSMLIDCMDYNEWKTGERVEAVFGAMNSLSMKLGSGFASILTGFVMGISGFDGMQAVQSASANASIVALYVWIPAAVFGVMVLLLNRYKIDKQMPQVRKELQERRQ